MGEKNKIDQKISVTDTTPEWLVELLKSLDLDIHSFTGREILGTEDPQKVELVLFLINLVELEMEGKLKYEGRTVTFDVKDYIEILQRDTE